MAEYEAFRDAPTPVGLIPCGNCGRTFNPEVLSKHEKICSSMKKRKTFDISKQRLQGLEVVPGGKKSSSQRVPRARNHADPTRPKKDWRQRHEDLINTIRSARNVTVAVKSGQPLPPPPPPTYDPDLVQCPHCNRRFNENAAERHMNFCKEKTSRLGAHNSKTVLAKDKLNKRTQYKPPLPGARKNSSSGQTPSRSQVPVAAAKKMPSQSPKPRRRDISDGMEYSSPENQFQKKGRASPPIQRRTLVLNKGHDHDDEDGSNYRRQGYGNNTVAKEYGYRNGDSRQSSSDSQKSSSRKGSGRDPQWFEDLKREKSRTPTETSSARYSSGKSDRSERSDVGSGRQRRYGSGLSDDLNDPFMNTADVPKQRRLPKSEHKVDFEERSIKGHGRTAVGVVRPSSRQESPKLDMDFEERTPSGRRKPANFCHECGTKYPVSKAKFCCECGMKRMHIDF